MNESFAGISNAAQPSMVNRTWKCPIKSRRFLKAG
jgi:hypothetical protein